MSGFVDFVMAKKSDAKAILKSVPSAGEKWPTVEWKWCFRPELASLYGILRSWPKKVRLKDKDIDDLEELIPGVGRRNSTTVDEETSAMVGEKACALAGLLWQLPDDLIKLIAAIDEKDDAKSADAWYKYFDHWEPAELVELIQALRDLCQRATKAKKCV